jgi:hypothetical protein
MSLSLTQAQTGMGSILCLDENHLDASTTALVSQCPRFDVKAWLAFKMAQRTTYWSITKGVHFSSQGLHPEEKTRLET